MIKTIGLTTSEAGTANSVVCDDEDALEAKLKAG